MGKPIYVEPHVYEDTILHYAFNSESSHHYCTYGATRDHCFDVAREMVTGMMEANRKDGCNKWTKIDIAVVPNPDMSGYYMIEDRSTWVR